MKPGPLPNPLALRPGFTLQVPDPCSQAKGTQVRGSLATTDRICYLTSLRAAMHLHQDKEYSERRQKHIEAKFMQSC